MLVVILLAAIFLHSRLSFGVIRAIQARLLHTDGSALRPLSVVDVIPV